MINSFKRTVLSSAAAATLALAITSGCTPQSPQPCDSSEFILAEDVTGEIIDPVEFVRRSTSYSYCESDGRLSLRLDLMGNSFGYADAVPFRLTVTNEIDEPVTFLRPHSISLEEGVYPIGLEIRLTSSSGETVHPGLRLTNPPFPSIARPRESFSTLPPRESCFMDFQLVWNQTWHPLEEPIPPGDYQMSVRFQGIAVGPQTDSAGEFLDVGAWVGCVEAPDIVTLTILPATKNSTMPY